MAIVVIETLVFVFGALAMGLLLDPSIRFRARLDYSDRTCQKMFQPSQPLYSPALHSEISKPGRHDTPVALLCRPWCGMVKDEKKTVVQGGSAPRRMASGPEALGLPKATQHRSCWMGRVYTLRITPWPQS